MLMDDTMGGSLTSNDPALLLILIQTHHHLFFESDQTETEGSEARIVLASSSRSTHRCREKGVDPWCLRWLGLRHISTGQDSCKGPIECRRGTSFSGVLRALMHARACVSAHQLLDLTTTWHVQLKKYPMLTPTLIEDRQSGCRSQHPKPLSCTKYVRNNLITSARCVVPCSFLVSKGMLRANSATFHRPSRAENSLYTSMHVGRLFSCLR